MKINERKMLCRLRKKLTMRAIHDLMEYKTSHEYFKKCSFVVDSDTSALFKIRFYFKNQKKDYCLNYVYLNNKRKLSYSLIEISKLIQKHDNIFSLIVENDRIVGFETSQRKNNAS